MRSEGHPLVDLVNLRGRELPEHRWVIEEGNVRSFIRAISRDPSRGSSEVPLTFSEASRTWQISRDLVEDLGLDLRYVLHGEQEILFYSALVVGQELRVRSRVEDVELKVGSRGGAMAIITVVSDFLDENDGPPRVVQQTRRRLVQTASAIPR